MHIACKISILFWIFQNIDLLRVYRFGPFSAIDLILTFHLAAWMNRDSRSNTFAIFATLLSTGELVHYLCGIETPFIKLATELVNSIDLQPILDQVHSEYIYPYYIHILTELHGYHAFIKAKICENLC
jgi:hypothetical protein